MSATQVVRASSRLAIARGSRAAVTSQGAATATSVQKAAPDGGSGGGDHDPKKLALGGLAAVGIGGAIYWFATAESRAKAERQRQEELKLQAKAQREAAEKKKKQDEIDRLELERQKRNEKEKEIARRERAEEERKEEERRAETERQEKLKQRQIALSTWISEALQAACEAEGKPEIRVEKCREALAMASELKMLGAPLEESSSLLKDPRLRQAEFFVDPKALLRALKSGEHDLFHGGSLVPHVDDFTNSAALLGKTEVASEELRQNLQEIARALATLRHGRVPDLRQALITELDSTLARYACEGGVNAAVQSLCMKNDCESRFERVRLESEIEARNAKQCRELIEQVFHQTNVNIQPQVDHIENDRKERLGQEIHQHLVDLLKLRAAVSSIAQDLDVTEIVQWNEHWWAKVSLALAGFEDAMASGGEKVVKNFGVLQKAVVGDEFLCNILDQVPKDALVHCSQGLTSEEPLQRRFEALKKDVKSIALTPGQGLGAAILGQLLAALYSVEPQGVPPPDLRVGATQRNLATLSEAAAALERGDVAEVIRRLEVLEGPCRARAEGWIKDARHSLIMSQAITVARARLRCINQVNTQG